MGSIFDVVKSLRPTFNVVKTLRPNPGALNGKSGNLISQSELNKLFKSLFNLRIYAGQATTMPDDPDAYLKEGYAGNIDVFSIIGRITRMAGQARLALYRKDKTGKWEEVTDHELAKFCTRVNQSMKTTDFIAGSIVYKLTIGNAFWYKPVIESGVNKGKTVELWLMPSNNVEIIDGQNWMRPIGGYKLNEGDTTATYTTDEVYHQKFFNPFFGDTKSDSLYGLSPLRAAAKVVAKQNQSETAQLKQFENQGPPYGLYRESDSMQGGALSPEQTQSISDLFKNYSKTYKAGHPIVLPDKFGVLNFGATIKDVRAIESSEVGRRLLCTLYGIPPQLMGDTSASTFNNVIEMKKDAWANCLKPLLKDQAQDMTNFLIEPVDEYNKEGLFFAFDYSEVDELQAGTTELVNWMKAAKATPNEIREAVGLSLIDSDAMNEPWVNMGEMPLSQAIGEDIQDDPTAGNKYHDYLKR